KAHTRGTAAAPRPADELLTEALAYCEHARKQGIDYLTFRRLAEVLGLDASHAHELRRNLVARNPEHYQAPLWSVTMSHTTPDGQGVTRGGAGRRSRRRCRRTASARPATGPGSRRPGPRARPRRCRSGCRRRG